MSLLYSANMPKYILLANIVFARYKMLNFVCRDCSVTQLTSCAWFVSFVLNVVSTFQIRNMHTCKMHVICCVLRILQIEYFLLVYSQVIWLCSANRSKYNSIFMTQNAEFHMLWLHSQSHKLVCMIRFILKRLYCCFDFWDMKYAHVHDAYDMPCLMYFTD